MKIQQLSLFLENKPGHLKSICETLADAGINIETLSLADTQQFGILRVITRNWEAARDCLEKAGFVVNVSEVVATEVEDRPGGMTAILDALEEGGINIEYMYAFTYKHGDKAVIILRLDNPDKAVELLEKKGNSVLDSVELFSGSES